MDSYRKIAVAVGVLFIFATLLPILSAIPLSSVPVGFLDSEGDMGYLAAVSANENQILTGALLLIAMTVSIVSIPILMYPILKKYSETLALGYVGARIFEGFFSAFNVITLLSILSLSKQFVSAGSPANSYFQIQGSVLLSGFSWGSLLLDFPFTISALIFNYMLYKTRLIPRWLSILGFVGGALWLSTVPLRMFGVFPSSLEVLALPIAAQEMIFAVWLIAKGFNSK